MPYQHFNVRPRYSGGSPAQIDEALARRLVIEERTDFDRSLAGYYGVEQETVARQLGLRGIVERRIERAGAWEVDDLLTGERFIRPFPPTRTETADQRERRFWRLRSKFRLPLERELPPVVTEPTVEPTHASER